MIDPKTNEKYWKCGRTEEIKFPEKRFPKKEQEEFKMQLEDFVIDSLFNTTTYENNFKYLMKLKNIKKVFPFKKFHGKDETFQYHDGKELFKEAIELKIILNEQNKKKSLISKGYKFNQEEKNKKTIKKMEKSKRIKKKNNY